MSEAAVCAHCKTLWPGHYRTCPVDQARLDEPPPAQSSPVEEWPPTMADGDLLGWFEREWEPERLPPEYRWGEILLAFAGAAMLIQAAIWGVILLQQRYVWWWVVPLGAGALLVVLFAAQTRGLGPATGIGRLLALPFIPFVRLLAPIFLPTRDVFVHRAEVRLQDTDEVVQVEARDPASWPEIEPEHRFVFSGRWLQPRYGQPSFLVRVAQPVNDRGYVDGVPIMARSDLPVVVGAAALAVVAAASFLLYRLFGVL